MNLKFDIDDDNYVSVTIHPDDHEDEGELHRLSRELLIRCPYREIIRHAKMGAYNHMADTQYEVYVNKIKTLEQFFRFESPTPGLPSGPIGNINIFLFLERLINAYINISDEDDFDEAEENQ